MDHCQLGQYRSHRGDCADGDRGDLQYASGKEEREVLLLLWLRRLCIQSKLPVGTME